MSFCRGLSTHSTTLVRASLLLAALALAVATHPVVAADASGQDTRSMSTLDEVRTVGVAIYQYVADLDAPDAPADEDEASSATIDWSRCPVISHEELTELLVPAYIAEIPRHDAWGHPYELCLNRRSTSGHPVMGVRSPGADGEFEGSAYVPGAFPASEPAHDIVWIDGYFITWPKRASE